MAVVAATGRYAYRRDGVCRAGTNACALTGLHGGGSRSSRNRRTSVTVTDVLTERPSDIVRKALRAYLA